MKLILLLELYCHLAIKLTVETQEGQVREFDSQNPTRKVSSFLSDEIGQNPSQTLIQQLNHISFPDQNVENLPDFQQKNELIQLFGPGISTSNSSWQEAVEWNRIEISDLIMNKYCNYMEWINQGLRIYSPVIFPVRSL